MTLPTEDNIKVDQFVLDLTVDGHNESSYSLATRAAELVKDLVETSDWGTADQLIRRVRLVCRRLEMALPRLHVIHNIIKRILKLIREEYLSASKSTEVECQPESLQKMLKSGDNVSDWGKTVSD